MCYMLLTATTRVWDAGYQVNLTVTRVNLTVTACVWDAGYRVNRLHLLKIRVHTCPHMKRSGGCTPWIALFQACVCVRARACVCVCVQWEHSLRCTCVLACV